MRRRNSACECEVNKTLHFDNATVSINNEAWAAAYNNIYSSAFKKKGQIKFAEVEAKRKLLDGKKETKTKRKAVDAKAKGKTKKRKWHSFSVILARDGSFNLNPVMQSITETISNHAHGSASSYLLYLGSRHVQWLTCSRLTSFKIRTASSTSPGFVPQTKI